MKPHSSALKERPLRKVECPTCRTDVPVPEPASAVLREDLRTLLRHVDNLASGPAKGDGGGAGASMVSTSRLHTLIQAADIYRRKHP